VRGYCTCSKALARQQTDCIKALQQVHVITSAAFHPLNSDLFGYSTTKNVLSLIDLRQKDLRGEHAVVFADTTSQVPQVWLSRTPLVCLGSLWVQPDSSSPAQHTGRVRPAQATGKLRREARAR
jgi:hypothetical protein